MYSNRAISIEHLKRLISTLQEILVSIHSINPRKRLTHMGHGCLLEHLENFRTSPQKTPHSYAKKYT